MRAAAWAYFRYLIDDRNRGRFVIELSLFHELVAAKRDFIMNAYAELVDAGNQERGDRPAVPRDRANAIVGLIWERAAKAVRADEVPESDKIVPELMYLTVLPYLGQSAAEQELERGPADVARYWGGAI